MSNMTEAGLLSGISTPRDVLPAVLRPKVLGKPVSIMALVT